MRGLLSKMKPDPSLVPLLTILLIIFSIAVYTIGVGNKQWRRFGLLQIGDKQYHVVYAISARERQQGLSDRQTIGADGMVFINPSQQQSKFWMYHMQFPLDFVWIADGKVVDLHRNVPAPDESGKIETIIPNRPVDMVVEFYSGTIDRENIVIGTPVSRVLNWYFSLW